MLTDLRSISIRQREDDLICSLYNSDKLYKLANRILFRYLQLAKRAGLSRATIIDNIGYLNFNKKKKTHKAYSRIPSPDFSIPGNAITKNGYNCTRYNCNEILKCANESELLAFNKKHNIKLLQITSAYYRFQMDRAIITYCVRTNSVLQVRVMKTFRELFHVPDSFKFADLESLVTRSEGFWFIPWLLFFAVSKVQSLMHRNLNEDVDYIRRWIRQLGSAANVELVSRSEIPCLRNQYNSDVNRIVSGNTFMKPTVNGIWWNLMKKYKKQIIAGPSSSSVIFYDVVFNITGILEPTRKNKVSALALVLADYYPVHHSISEILQLYTEDADLPTYSLDMDDIEYLRRLGITRNM